MQSEAQVKDWISSLETAHDESLDAEHFAARSILREVIEEMRAALASPSPQATADEIAQHIRKVDGGNRMGAGALGEALHEWLASRPPSPQPAEKTEPVARFLKFGESIATHKLAFVELLGAPVPDAKLFYAAPLPTAPEGEAP